MEKQEFKIFSKYEMNNMQSEKISGGNMGFPLLPYYLGIAANKLKEFIVDLIQPDENTNKNDN